MSTAARLRVVVVAWSTAVGSTVLCGIAGFGSGDSAVARWLFFALLGFCLSFGLTVLLGRRPQRQPATATSRPRP